MSKIMKDYKVDEVANMVQEKVRKEYLQNQLPDTKSDLEKAIRTIEKNEDVFLLFVYRMDQKYLSKINPNFDMLGALVNIILKKRSGKEAANVLEGCKAQKSFNLYWKSLVGKEKKEFVEKWISVGLP